MTELYYQILPDTPIGSLELCADDDSLRQIRFLHDATSEQPLCDGQPILLQAVTELNEYFSRKRREFSVPLSIKGTDFQQQVWQILSSIPYGKTLSYGDIALRLNKPDASRAVGMANNRNPLPIIIPCHRVIGANGKLVGYAGGIGAKRLLLALEQPQLEFGLD